MKKIYLVKKDVSKPDSSDNWIIMNSFEFYKFTQTPEGQERKDNFGRVPNGSETDVAIFAECGQDKADSWKSEINRSVYIEKVKDEMGTIIFSYNTLNVNDEDVSGEEMIVDKDCDVELYVVKKIEREELHKAISKLSAYDRILVFSLFLMDKPMTEQEFADKYHIKRRTVSYHKSRALQRLKKLLTNQK